MSAYSKMSEQKTFLRDRLPSVLLIAAIFALWQAAAMIIGMEHILPSPVGVILKIWELREVLFLHHLPSTLITVAAGWGLAIAAGTALAVLMHFSWHAEAMLRPALTITQTIPVMCISPLFVVWMGYTLQARLLAVVLSTFFAITLNTYEGFKSSDSAKRELLLTYGASKKDIFFYLDMPSALPGFFTALKMTLPWAVIDAAVAEWLGATEGLGYFSKRMISRMDGAAVFAPIVILCAVALAGMTVLKYVDKKYIKWRNEV